MNPQHEEYGTERLVDCIQSVADRKAAEIVNYVSTDVARFSRQGTHLDDKVMIVIKVG
jgi:serine phosphatase RsbU (regulator of sigma subunit)